MDVLGAIEWVSDHKLTILGKVRKFLSYTPYDEEDYLQLANEAAIVASNWYNEKEATELRHFEKVFWSVFKQKVSQCTPNPINIDDFIKEAEERFDGDASAVKKEVKKLKNKEVRASMSIPCKPISDENLYDSMVSLMVDDFFSSMGVTDDVVDYESRFFSSFESCDGADELERRFNRFVPYLGERERVIAEHLLGLADTGKSSMLEISRKTGIHINSVAYSAHRLGDRINKIRQKHFTPRC